jgi:hypothetical protein
MPRQGSRRLARVLRPSSRALKASAHNECHRKRILNDPLSQRALQEGASLTTLRSPGIYKPAEAAEKSWRHLGGRNQLPKVILGVKFADRVEIKLQEEWGHCSRRYLLK